MINEIFDNCEVLEGDYLCTYFLVSDDDCPIPHWELGFKELLKH